MRVAGSRPQGPVGQVSRGLGARAPRAWGPPSETIQRSASRLGVRQQACRKSTRRDPGPRGLWARSIGGLGPGPLGLGARPTKGLRPFPTFANRGCRLKRLLRRWGPGGKRSRDTPPTRPPPPPRFKAVREKRRGFSPATIQHAPQGRRIDFTYNSPLCVFLKMIFINSGVRPSYCLDHPDI